MAGIVETITGRSKVEATPAASEDIQLLKRVLKGHGIDAEAEIRNLKDQDREAENRRRQAEAAEQSRLAEEAHSVKVAKDLIKAGHLVIKIDGKRVDDITAPCPDCGAGMSDVAYMVRYFAEMVWRNAGGNLDALIVGDSGLARMPLSVTTQVCPKCSTKHRVTVQLVL